MDDAPSLVPQTDFSAVEDDPMLGRVLAGRFTILSRLGCGSMGTVYRASQAPIGRHVAIKILRSERAVDEGSRARFLREARANSALTSPNTVTVFDFGQSETGDFYLAMELLEGESVGERIRRVGRFHPSDALETAKQALRSLCEAHAKGIIHRDLKPDNLFFARVQAQDRHDEIVKVLDFGVAKMLRDEDAAPMSVVETQAGTVFGTPRYMSPEQAQGRALDARTDLYSLGVILYHMLAGRPPFMDDDAIVVMARHIKSAPLSLSEAAPDLQLPPALEAAVMRTLSKEPDLRPPSAEAMLVELTLLQQSLTSGSSGVRSIPTSEPPSPMEEATWLPARRRARALLALGGGLFAGLAVAAAVHWFAPSREPVAASPSVSAASAMRSSPTLASPPPATSAEPPALDPASLPLARLPATRSSGATGPMAHTPEVRPARPPRAPAAAAAPSGAAAVPSAPASVPGATGKSTTKPPVGYGYLE